MIDFRDFFLTPVAQSDPEVASAIASECRRQETEIELIASENIVSRAVLDALGSPLTNKYAEGYPGRRYYGGCAAVDEVERLAITRACRLFGCRFANVQAHSGSQANLTVFLALLRPGDGVMGLDLSAGGHLSHGSAPNISGKWFRSLPYGVGGDGLIDYAALEVLARKERPKLLIAGGSAYPRSLDFARFRAIADQVEAKLLVDMAHFAGLVATGLHDSPFPHADVVTTTTHKTLRGARGGLVLCNDEALARAIDRANFPGLQGGPLMHAIAGKAVALGEALRPDFSDYIRAMVGNAQSLARALRARGFDLVTGGTDTHLLLIDLRRHGLTGKAAEAHLERAGLTCNKNGVPDDSLGPTVTSGLRLGSPAGTTRGFDEEIFAQIGEMVADILDAMTKSAEAVAEEIVRVRAQTLELCRRFPLYERS